LLCVHKESCLICGNKNIFFPQAQWIISRRFPVQNNHFKRK
jgi:hypothetical protein